jgi:transposase
MPKSDVIVNVPGITVKKVINLRTRTVLVQAVCTAKGPCPHCGAQRLRNKGKFIRQVRHQSIGLRNSVLRIQARKFRCLVCLRYFRQPLPGVLPRHRATQKLKEQVFKLHSQGISQVDLESRFHVSQSTLERYFHEYYWREHQKILHRDCPSVLGIDEHFFSRGKRFATTLCDLRKHRVFDVVDGRSQVSLASFLEQLPGKEAVKVICMDLSTTYRRIAKHYFPNAKVVADRFHVIRLINHLAMQAYTSIDPTIKYNRGLLAVLRTHPERLSSKRKQLRDYYFQNNKAIEAIYAFKQQLHSLLMIKHQTQQECQELIPKLINMIAQLKSSPIRPLAKLGKTLYRWREEIASVVV